MTDTKPKKKSESRKRTKRITVRFTEEEYTELKKLSAQCSQAPSTYLRVVGLNKKIKSTFDSQVIIELGKLRSELGRLGGLVKAWLSPKQTDIGVTPESKDYLENNKPALKALLRDLDSNVFMIEDIVKKL